MADQELAADIADLLLTWRSERGSPTDVAGVLILALQQYSRGVNGAGDSFLMECLVKLRQKSDIQILSMSIK